MSGPDPFKQKTLLGLKWSMVHQIFQFLLQLISSIVLARLLTPDDYGLFGMVQVIAGFAMIIADFGLSSAVIQAKKIDNDQLSTVFWLNVGIGLLMTTLFYFAAYPIAAFYEVSSLVLIAQLAGCNFIINSLGIVHSTFLTRSIDFKSRFIIGSISSVLSFATAVILAKNNYGPLTLVYHILINSTLRVLLLWSFKRWTPSLMIRISSIRKLFRFSFFLLATNSVRFWTRNLDSLLIGKVIGAPALGIYNKSYSLMMLPLNNISNVISRVMFPSLSSIQDDTERIKSVYLKMTFVIGMITFPLMSGLCIVAPTLVPVVFGEQWTEMIFVLQVLSIVAIPQSIGTLNGNLYLVKGKTDLQFKVSLIMHLVIILFLVVGVFFGLKVLVIFYAIGSFTILYHNFKFPLALINTKFKELVQNVYKLLVSALVMAGVVGLLHLYLAQYIQGGVLLVTEILAGMLTYGVLVWTIENGKCRWLLSELGVRSFRE